MVDKPYGEWKEPNAVGDADSQKKTYKMPRHSSHRVLLEPAALSGLAGNFVALLPVGLPGTGAAIIGLR